MKHYIVLTSSDFDPEITAYSFKDAIKKGKALCKRIGERFVKVLICKN